MEKKLNRKKEKDLKRKLLGTIRKKPDSPHPKGEKKAN